MDWVWRNGIVEYEKGKVEVGTMTWKTDTESGMESWV